MSEPRDDKVIRLRPEDHKRIRLKAQKSRYDGACEHKRSEVDAKLRIVTCRDCGVKLDPIEVLIDVCHWGRSLDWRIQALKDYERRDAEKREKAKQRREAKRAALAEAPR